MVIKNADDRTQDVAELKALLKRRGLSNRQRQEINREISSYEKGSWGESKAAYYLDFHFGKSERTILLHDLRIVLSDGRTAQIDHLLINRFLEIYILESKNWHELTVDEKGFCTTLEKGKVVGTESPLEQCKRHEVVLKRAFEIEPRLRSLARTQQMRCRVLVAPRCHLRAPYHTEYIKADAFHAARSKDIDNMSAIEDLKSIPRLISFQSLQEIGNILVELHNPGRRDWAARFGLPPQREPNSIAASFAEFDGHVPDWGKDWFVLKKKPSDSANSALRKAGYRPSKEGDDWVWRLRG